MQIEKFNLSEIKDKVISFLELGTSISIYFDDNITAKAFPELFLVERIDSTTVKITPKDDLDDFYYIVHDYEKYPYTVMIQRVNQLVATISVIKQFSTTEPQFEFETVNNFFRYSFTLKGDKFSDIFDQIVIIYDEIDRRWTDDDTYAIDYFLTTID